jgi:hypothetical protein
MTNPASRVTVRGPYAPSTRSAARDGDVVISVADRLYSIEGAGDRRLALVGQLRQCFVDEHPDVPVLIRAGRYLVVDATDRELVSDRPACWDIVELDTAGPTITTRRRAARQPPIGWVQALVDQVDAPRLAGDLALLAGFPTRHSKSSHYANARDQLRARLDSLGYLTSIMAVTVGSGSGSNLIAERAGTASDRGLVIVTAHLDSVNLAGGEAADAPGADDNASGSAGLMEIARIVATHAADHDLRLVLFGGEEQGLLGSIALVSAMTSAERSRVRAVVNMDMIAVRNSPGSSAVLLEGASVSSHVIDALADAAATYTGLDVTTSLNPFASDHVPFINAGMPAALTIEGNDSANTAIHTAGDIVSRTDANLAAEIVRMNVAAVAVALGRQGADVTSPIIPTEPPIGPIDLNPVIIELLRPRLSGRYEYNGGADTSREPVTEERFTPSPDGPDGLPPLPSPELPVLGGPRPTLPTFPDNSWLERLRRPSITLRVDVDRSFPLNVVSGAVRRSVVFGSGPATPFIGRVTSNTRAGSTTTLLVEDFTFTWPGSTYVVTRLEVQIDAPPFETPVARAKFVTTTPGREYGPYTLERVATTFHEVEIEVDREDSAIDCEPYGTHGHPDRPATLTNESLRIENVFGRAGIGITRSASSNVINTSDAGTDNKWSESELHDAMEAHWAQFANIPQWKLWVFLAEQATSATLGGIMFDGDINEPGGVDRQGTAIFTKCEFFHGAGGAYPLANPPAAAAATRELFFDLIHEMGHAFNLAHSFQKTSIFNPGDSTWPAPAWMPVVQDPQALSFMNYPDEASPGSGHAAKWFYDQFRFRFDDNELLFLRHAPERFVQMGNQAWFSNHGRVAGAALDPRLELTIRTLTPSVHWGTPLQAELKLKNVSGAPIVVDPVLDPVAEGTKIAVIDPAGERRPFIPFLVERQLKEARTLAPGESIYVPVTMAVGKLGVPFKQPGLHTVQASYANYDGGAAAAAMYVNVLAPTPEESMAASALHTAPAARVLSVGGTRTIGEVRDQLQWAADKLGPNHPTTIAIKVAQALPLAHDFKVLAGDSSSVDVLNAEPDVVEKELRVLTKQPEKAADTLGHIEYERVVDTYTACAVEAGRRKAAADSQRAMVGIFKQRDVVESAIDRAEVRLQTLQ